KRRRQPEEEADGRADGEREEIALPHADQRVERQAPHTLVHLSILEERLQHVAARLAPRLGRRGQVRGYGLAHHRPEDQPGGGPKQRQGQPAWSFARAWAIDWMAKLRAYLSGSAGSNVTPSKKVSFFMSSRGISTPMPFATSLK